MYDNSKVKLRIKKKKCNWFHILLLYPQMLFNLVICSNCLLCIPSDFLCRKKLMMPGTWWLSPEILAMQKAEIRRIMVWSQARQIVCEILSQKSPSCIPKKKGWQSSSRCRPWVQTPVPKEKKQQSCYCKWKVIFLPPNVEAFFFLLTNFSD
jgi:hypothetical protein